MKFPNGSQLLNCVLIHKIVIMLFIIQAILFPSIASLDEYFSKINVNPLLLVIPHRYLYFCYYDISRV